MKLAQTKKAGTLIVRVPEHTLTTIDAAADCAGRTRSDWVRRQLADVLERFKAGADVDAAVQRVRAKARTE